MILAAGFGERLRPLTERRAKPSIPLLNRPLILRTLDYLRDQGVTKAVINLHHLPGSIRAVVEIGRNAGLQVDYSEEKVILGTAGGLKKAEAHFQDGETLALINSDFIIDCDLRAALRAHRDSGALATMILVPSDGTADYGVVEMDDAGSIHRIAGRPATRRRCAGPGYTFTGVHLLEPAILAAIPPATPSCINKDIYPDLIAAGRSIRGLVHRGRWLEFGTPQLFLDGSLALLRAGDYAPATPHGPRGRFVSHPEAVPAGSTVEPPVLIGEGCTFGNGVSLSGGVVLGDRVAVGAGARLQSTILHDDARIGDGSCLDECLIDEGVNLPAGTRLRRSLVVPEATGGGADQPARKGGGCVIAEF